MNDPTSETAVPSPKRRKILRALGEIALVAAVIAFAAWYFRAGLDVAANMPQEAPKYGVGAWNLYKTGNYVVYINHQPHPAAGGIGYAFLIVPSFWIFGDFIGNAIYTQYALAILTCIGIYFATRLCFGLWPAILAGIMLPLYRQFDFYARILDTSIPSAFFFVVGLLIFLWILRSNRAQFWKWTLWGLCAGWATAVRTSNGVIFFALTIALLWLLRAQLKLGGGTLRICCNPWRNPAAGADVLVQSSLHGFVVARCARLLAKQSIRQFFACIRAAMRARHPRL